jgi:hypothetical protein
VRPIQLIPAASTTAGEVSLNQRGDRRLSAALRIIYKLFDPDTSHIFTFSRHSFIKGPT